MKKAAGIAFVFGEEILLLKKNESNSTNSWELPGGHLEEGESVEEAAVREAIEEIGRPEEEMKKFIEKEGLEFLDRNFCDETEYFAFKVNVKEKFHVYFDIKKRSEHSAFQWFNMNDNLEINNIHPKVQILIKKIKGNEVDIAKMMSMGELTSPQFYHNVKLFDIRVTGTGFAYRSKPEEICYREPKFYLSDEFLERCNGLPVIYEHPEKSLLNSKEFKDRIVGTILLPYIKGDEVWAIAKIYENSALNWMLDETLPNISTSPGISIDSNQNKVIIDPQGRKILFEGPPVVIDHLAICEVGVWDKLGPPVGVNLNGLEGFDEMADKLDSLSEEKKEEKKFDAAEAMSSLMDSLKGISEKVDSMTRRMDAMEEKKDPKEEEKKDSKEEEKKDSKEEEKKDSSSCSMPRIDSKEEEYKKDSFRKDADISFLKKKLAELETQIPKQITDADYSVMSDIQLKYDTLARGFGKQASRPLLGEAPGLYSRRLAREFQTHSKAWKDIDLVKLDPQVFEKIAEPAIYNDAMEASNSPIGIEPGNLRKIIKKDITGREIITWAGSPKSWMQDFMQPSAVGRFRNPSEIRNMSN
jgi:8-oxo-dGTP pyrophosphatase MutT (NUDIX family)